MIKVAGYSDDIIYLENMPNLDEDEIYLYDEVKELKFSDGTVVRWKYDMNGIWRCKVVEKGSKFENLDVNPDDDDDRYSDILMLQDFEDNGLVSVETVEEF